MAVIFVNLFLGYLMIGFLFAIAFVFKGVQKVDPIVAESNWKFRLLIIPGSLALWPVMLKKWLQAK